MRSLIHPEFSDIPQLKKIWCEGFPEDEKGYCDFYFEKHFRPERSLAVYNGKEIESALHLFDAYYKGPDGKRYDFLYPYAGATLEKYKGHRNLKYLIDGCMKYASETGKCGIIVAGTEEIIYLYDRWGFEKLADLNIYSLQAVPKDNGLFWKPCTYEKYHLLHTAYLDKIGNCFYWGTDAQRFMYEDIVSRGQILACSYGCEEYFAVCAEEEDCLVIQETSFPLDHADLLTESICRYFSWSGQMAVHSHREGFCSNKSYTAERIYNGHYGMVCQFSESELLRNAYISLIGE